MEEAYAASDLERRTTSPLSVPPRIYGSAGYLRNTPQRCYPGTCDENCPVARIRRTLPPSPPSGYAQALPYWKPASPTGEIRYGNGVPRPSASRVVVPVNDTLMSRTLSEAGTSSRVRSYYQHPSASAAGPPRGATDSPVVFADRVPLFSLRPTPSTRPSLPAPLSPSENRAPLPRLVESPFNSLTFDTYQIPPASDATSKTVDSLAEYDTSESKTVVTPPWLLPSGPTPWSRPAVSPFRPQPRRLSALPKTYYRILRAPVDQASSVSSSKPGSRSSSTGAPARGRKRKAASLESDSIPPPQPSCSCCDAAKVRCLPARSTRNGSAACARCRKLDLACDHAFKRADSVRPSRDHSPATTEEESEPERPCKRHLSYILNP